MHLRRGIKLQLAIFALVAVVAISILTLNFGRAGQLLFGAGGYQITLELPRAAGLYDRANVTFMGVPVGRVQHVSLTETGVQASLFVNSDLDIPSGVKAEVHSQTAIGEQYVALVPRDTPSPPLRNGSVIAVANTALPDDLNDLFDKGNTALDAVPKPNIKTVIDESYTAVGGLGPELSRIVDSTTKLASGAREHLSELNNVIDGSAPLLDAQGRTADAISAWAAHLATLTGQIQQNDPAFSQILTNTGPATEQTKALIDQINPSLPLILANLVGLDDVGLVYNANLEQILVLFPQDLALFQTAAVANVPTKQPYVGAYVQAVTNLNVPPTCTTGYLPPSQWRSPVFEDAPPRPPGNLYCRIPQDSRNAVRGARNIPCAQKPWKRAPSAAMCESDENYVPLNDGNNWKGDPNATLSGQDIPQLPALPGQQRVTPGAARASADGAPPPDVAPGALGFADYNPADGTYLGPDGQIYTQGNLARDARPPTWQSLLTPQPIP